MKEPTKLWISPDKAQDEWGTLKIGDNVFWDTVFDGSEDLTLYHHDDTVTALQAEVDRLREAARAVITAADKWNAEQSREAFGAMSRAIDATRAALEN